MRTTGSARWSTIARIVELLIDGLAIFSSDTVDYGLPRLTFDNLPLIIPCAGLQHCADNGILILLENVIGREAKLHKELRRQGQACYRDQRS